MVKSSPLNDVKKHTSDGCMWGHVVTDNPGRAERKNNGYCKKVLGTMVSGGPGGHSRQHL